MNLPHSICQSCAMVMTEQDHGTNADGSVSGDYCKYCFSGGKFTKDETMEERIEDDIRFWIGDECKTEEEVRAKMREIFPTLKRWKQRL